MALKLDLDFLLDLYDAYLRDDSKERVSGALGLTWPQLEYRLLHSPHARLAKQKATERRKSHRTLAGYVFQHLTPDAKEVWEEIQWWSESRDSTEMVRDLVLGKPVKLRQELFIHALVSVGFDFSAALSVVALSYTELKEWLRVDLEFRQLVEEIQWHKKNFFEKGLVDLVSEGNPSAIIFANRTINADRGYSEKLHVLQQNVPTGSGEFQLSDLDLSLECRKEILAAIRKKKEAAKNSEDTKQLAEMKRALPA